MLIEYKNKSNKWKFVEAKTMSEDQFIVSASEKDKRTTEPDRFEMTLVKDNVIYMKKDIFKFKQGKTLETIQSL
ncbi:hypothetical protein [Chryseobacterium turcicum]|uniref:Uncharacterized protein n=1 Tax=Chryseobacterium turcicum TaxID=2898076 RepID=A0A9Q3V3P2_9FLAO|nr:hypothetical protein [Chryseobacterium turcicum]MCD1117572.1 hypothetical protein [Chryseobacterium turcicum]